MLVEISEKTLERLRAWSEAEKAADATSIEEWNDVKMNAMYACNSIKHDIGMTALLNTISNKADDYAQEQVDTARTLNQNEQISS
jgi:hypothetical protein